MSGEKIKAGGSGGPDRSREEEAVACTIRKGGAAGLRYPRVRMRAPVEKIVL